MSATAVIKLNDKTCRIFIKNKRKIIYSSSKYEFEDKDTLSERLIKDLEQLSIEYKLEDAIVITSFFLCSSGIIDLPVVDIVDIESALSFELEKQLPLPISDYKIAFDVIEKKKNESRIVYCAIPRREFEFYSALIEKTGLRLKSFRVGFFEFLRIFISRNNSLSGSSIFIVNEDDRLCLAVFRDHKLFSVKHIKNIKQLTMEIEDLVSDGINDIYGVNLDLLKIDNFKLKPLEISENELISILDNKKKPCIDFLVKPTEKQFRKYNSMVTLLLVLTVLLLLLSYLVPYYLDLRMLNNINSEINKIKSTASDVINMNKQLQHYKEILREYEAIRKRALFPVNALVEITEKVPDNTWLYNFKYEKGMVEIQGFSESAIDLIKPLEDSEIFKNVRFVSPIVTRNNKDRFRIRMEIEK